MKTLITGGAGFIGSRLALKLAGLGHRVTVLDSLSPQVHGAGGGFDPALAAAAECVQGDVRDRALIERLTADQEIIVHLAAETGTGQSMYEVERYQSVNIGGAAVLMETLVNRPPPALRKLLVASSRAIYGEGQYHCPAHGTVFPSGRSAIDLAAGRFDPVCPECSGVLSVEATREDAPFAPSSFYGLTKQVQEQMVLMFAKVLGLDAFALRYQNVYGPGQSLSNPYTGILAIFAQQARQGQAINVFEDGEESRDFVYIDDVVEATAACLAPQATGVHALNVGGGARVSVREVAAAIVAHFGSEAEIRVTGDFRVGDIRHNLADLSQLHALTGFQPIWRFSEGLARFLSWAEQYIVTDGGYETSLIELRARGLLGTTGKDPA
ncbi:MAG: NAD-dependent epimerase/dehydratase family protein [Caulobacteraceae bacterium]